MLEKLTAPSFTQINSTSNLFVEEEEEVINSDRVQRMMNLPEPISINRVNITRDQLNDDGYDLISDESIQNDSREEVDNSKRIIYSRERLLDISKLIDFDYCPKWIKDNPDFPKRVEFSDGLCYLDKLINYENHFNFSNKRYKPTNEGAIDQNKKELSGKNEDRRNQPSPFQSNSQQTIRSFDNLDRGNDFNRERAFDQNSNPNVKSGYNNHSNYNSNNGNYKNNNIPMNSQNNKFGDRQAMFNHNNNNRNGMNDRMMDDRNDGRGFSQGLRSRGENLSQNFASFRRFQNRNQPNDRYHNPSHSNYGQRAHDEPEWFTGGPVSQHDTIELKGFNEDDDKLNSGNVPSSNSQQQSPHHPMPSNQQQQQQQQQPAQQAQPSAGQQQQFKSNLAVDHRSNGVRNDFDLNDFTNIDWQNVDARHNVDKVTIENQANSSRFARWFNDQNEPHHQSHDSHSQQQQSQPQTGTMNATEDQIEKLFSSARNFNIINPNINSTQQPLTPQFDQQQQQINLQNDFFGNLMNRNLQPNIQQQLHQQYLKAQQQHLQNPPQQFINRMNQQQAQEDEMSNAGEKKTDQQLFNILQKARINMNGLIAHQNVLNQDNIIRGQVKSAEELEASLLNNNSPPESRRLSHPMVLNQDSPSVLRNDVNPADLFQKMSLNGNNTSKFGSASQDDNCAINPFVMNLLDDAQKQKNMLNNVMNNRNFNQQQMPNMMIYNNNSQQPERREEKVNPTNPFMPTSVIRKIAKEKNSLGAVGGNKGLSETNFEIVTGNHISERSILHSRAIAEEQQRQFNQAKGLSNNFAINPATLAQQQQNFAIATSNRWGDNSIQQPTIDSTTPNHTTVQQNREALRNILIKASKRPVDPNTLFNNMASKNPGNNQQYPKVQNDNQKKLIEILQKASTNYNKVPGEGGNKINNWFDLELKRNNDLLSPIIKENAFTLEDIENN